MAAYIPSHLQKRLLRYALLQTGFLDTKELDLESLDIALGRQNSIELRDVSLSTSKLSGLLSFPPELRLEAAKILRLRLIVPTDLFTQSITAEAHGVRCELRLGERSDSRETQIPHGQDVSQRNKEHRKAHRRIPRTPQYDPGGDDRPVIPSTNDLAQSFLLEESSSAEVNRLKSDYAVSSWRRPDRMQVSLDPEEEQGTGTGTTPGLPGFLAGFLQGIVDRFALRIYDVTARLLLDMDIPRPHVPSSGDSSLFLELKIANIMLDSSITPETTAPRKHIAISDVQLSIHGLHPARSESDPVQSMPVQAPSSPFDPQVSSPLMQPTLSPSMSTVLPTFDQDQSVTISAAQKGRNIEDSSAFADHLPAIETGDDNTTWNLRRTEAPESGRARSTSDKADDLTASFTADRHVLGFSGIAEDRESKVASLQTSSQSISDSFHQPVPPIDTGASLPADPSAKREMSPSPLISQFAVHTSRPGLAADVESTNIPRSPSSIDEEDASMYMSAVSTGLGDLAQSPTRSVAAIDQASAGTRGTEHLASQPLDDEPLAESQVTLPAAGSDLEGFTQRVCSIDAIHLWLPTATSPVEPESTSSQDPAVTTMPGAFSVYADQSASVRFDDHHLAASRVVEPRSVVEVSTSALKVQVGSVRFAVELLVLAQYLALCQKAFSFLKNPEPEDSFAKAAPNDSQSPSIDLAIETIEIALCHDSSRYWAMTSYESITPPELSSGPSRLLAINLQALHVRIDPRSDEMWRVDLGVIGIRLADQPILSFTDKLHHSTRTLLSSDSDVVIVGQAPRSSLSGSSIQQISMQTKVLELDLSMDRLEETFQTYGGLSSLIELGSSMTSSPQASQSTSPTGRKGVRFEDSPRPSVRGTETKLNARIGGFHALLSSRSAAIEIQTTSIKAVTRSEYVAATIDQIHVGLKGKSSFQNLAKLTFFNLRVEYLFRPKDADLETLLNLLTPSKNKYENDDDILLDTLLRQRRKGSVFRLTLAKMMVKIEDIACLEVVQAFGNEVSGLSAVTKYLPEDERPGLLALAHLQSLVLELPVNRTFGQADVELKDVGVAHVGLPSLLALAVGSVSVRRHGSFSLLHDFVPAGQGDGLPVIMARMIGDEIEPTIRLKIYNLCVEYSVAALLSFIGDNASIEAHQVVDLMSSTVLEAAERAVEGPSPQSSFDSSSSKNAKRLKISMLFRDCIVGLQPSGLDSKVLIALNDAKISTTLPRTTSLNVKVEMRKAKVLVAHQVLPLETKLTGLASVEAHWTRMGFIPAASLMSAVIDTHIIEKPGTTDRLVEVEVLNELLLLETCADSTATLMKVMGALAPPSAPSSQPKYRTEAITMDEMVASFTGEAFEKPSGPPSTVFDVETAVPLDDEDLIDEDMSRSIYGDLGEFADPEDDIIIQGDASDTIAESFLDEDPFEMPADPNIGRLNSQQLELALNQQLACNLPGGPIEIQPHLFSDEHVISMAGESVILGQKHRWGPSKGSKDPTTTAFVERKIPLKVKVRDVHVIWNLHDGYDWQSTQQAITKAVEEIEHRAEERKVRRRIAEPDDEESVIGDCLFNSIYIGVPTSREAQDLRRTINRNIDDTMSETESHATSGVTRSNETTTGREYRQTRPTRKLKLARSRAHKMSFELKGISADVLVFTPGESETQNAVDVRVREFEIFDNLPSSTWRKFLTSWDKDDIERDIGKPMIHLELSSIRPILDLSATDLVIRATICPLRLHVDQDALDFVTRFFDFKNSSEPQPTHANPNAPFIQRLEIHTVDLSLDYKPKRVDYAGLRSGRYTELKNFFILDAAHIKLRHAILYGIKGFEPLHDTLNDIWMPDIKANQLPGILSGLATVSPLVSLGTGIAEVVAVPIREYRKDGRIVRSIQKGAVQLLRNTTSEAARFGARVAVGAHNVLGGAEGLLSANERPSSASKRRSIDGWTDLEPEEREERKVSSYASQPVGVLSGLKSARRYLERDLLLARDAFIAVQGEILEGGSAASAAQAVVRHAPTILLRPVMGATSAVGQTLMGVGNQIDRRNVQRIDDKYKRR